MSVQKTKALATPLPVQKTLKTVDYQRLFESLPDRYIAFYPDVPAFTIAAETGSHAGVSGVRHRNIVGKPLLEAFPDTSEKYKKTGVSDLVESLRKVVKTGKPDSLETQYDNLPHPDGTKETRYWRVTHYPLFNDDKKLVLIYQATYDISYETVTENKLERIQRQLDEALSVGMVGTWLWDVPANVVIGDASMAAMFGVSAKQAATGLPLSAFTNAMHPDDRERVRNEIAAALKAGSNFHSEYRSIGRGGTVRWLIARGRLERDSRGKPTSFPGVLVDITERKLAEEALKQREQEFRLLADNMPNLAFKTNADGWIYWYNSRWYEYTGKQPKDLEGWGWQSVHDPKELPHVMKKWQASIHGGEPFEMIFPLKGADNKYRSFLTRILPIKDDKGVVTQWFGTNTDITDQKQAESNLSYLAKASAALSTSLDYKKTLQAIAKLMVPDIADWCSIEILDSDNQLQQVAIAHKDPAKVKWAVELRKKQGPPNLDEPGGVAEVLRSGKPEFYPYISDELLVASAKSKAELKLLRDLAMNSVIIVALKVNNKPVGAISLISTEQSRNFTGSDLEMAEELASRASLAMTNASLYTDAQNELAARTRLEKALLLANEELENRVAARTAELESTNLSLQRSNQELQDFAYVASHDLQEPLRKIQAFGNLLESEYSDQLGEGADYLGRMRNAAARMSALIEDILSFSRVNTKGRDFAPVNLRTVIDEVVDDLEIRIRDTKAVFEIGQLPVVQADAMQMRQLLQNLMANALKFHRDGVPPVIKIRASTESRPNDKMKYCRLEIEDNGLGFEEKYLDRIFAVFQRLHNRDSYEGTGIGLAVCRKIVERHGGSITATSSPGKGSTFIITLPMRHKKGENLL